MATERAQGPTERSRRHAVVFTRAQALLEAVHLLRAHGFACVEAHTPFAVHGLDAALGLEDTRLPWVTLLGGSLGGVLGLAFPLWTHAVDWPLRIGGKDPVAWPAIIPVTFELVVLLAAFATLGGLLWRSQLRPRLNTRRPGSQPLAEATDDRFVLVVEECDGSFDAASFDRLCRKAGAHAVHVNWMST